jgi:indolepyruvate ferredoxin oxidoreductase alpha subunit
MGHETREASIVTLGKACGIQRTRVVNPYDLKATGEAIAEEIAADEPSLIVSQAPCPLHQRKPVGPKHRIDRDRCRGCSACLKLGCPAIEGGSKPTINELLCGGCSLCHQVCRFAAITPAEEAQQ